MSDRITSIRIALLAVFAFSAIGAPIAQAEEGAPYWSIEGTRLAAGKTAEVATRAVSAEQTLTSATGQNIACTTLAFKPGAVLLGSNGNEPGKSDETVEYSGCSVTGNGTKCAVTGGAVTTEPLTNELAYAENKKSLVIELTPTKGKTLATVKFTAETGGTCTVATTKVTGQVVAKMLTGGGSPKLLELPNQVEPAEAFRLEFPATAITHIWLITAGTGKAVEVEELNAFGSESVYAGTAEDCLTSGKKYSPSL
jgi:hypothetical protein